jgi:hypothetical protein
MANQVELSKRSWNQKFSGKWTYMVHVEKRMMSQEGDFLHLLDRHSKDPIDKYILNGNVVDKSTWEKGGERRAN